MGNASTKVRNDTPFPISVCLAQIGPLYYCNVLEPGEEYEFKKLGKVWFTLKVELNVQKKKVYTDANVVMPIFEAAVAAGLTALTAGAATGLLSVEALVASTAGYDVMVSEEAAAAGVAGAAAITGEEVAVGLGEALKRSFTKIVAIACGVDALKSISTQAIDSVIKSHGKHRTIYAGKHDWVVTMPYKDGREPSIDENGAFDCEFADMEVKVKNHSIGPSPFSAAALHAARSKPVASRAAVSSYPKEPPLFIGEPALESRFTTMGRKHRPVVSAHDAWFHHMATSINELRARVADGKWDESPTPHELRIHISDHWKMIKNDIVQHIVGHPGDDHHWMTLRRECTPRLEGVLRDFDKEFECYLKGKELPKLTNKPELDTY